jgi:amino-acid N-acetyltransferase
MKAEKAHINDIPQIRKLVNHFADKGEMLPRALSELYENMRDFVVVRDGEKLVACAALHIFWSDLAEIRAVCVAEEIQDKGAGALLMQACLEEVRSMGIETIFCLTYVPNFFVRFGFREVDKSELPRKVWGECLRCPKFPDCDEVAMIYHVEPVESPS